MLGPVIVDRPPTGRANAFYAPNRAPLKTTPFVPLPITSFAPKGWLRENLELQARGLTGHLGEISIWLTKPGNAWLSKDGLGAYGWEEVPYWLRGYSRIGYVLRDPKMIAETRFWVEGTIRSQRPDGDFGPVHNHSQGFRDLWPQMLMLQVLQSWYEFTGDRNVLTCMSRYFKWELQIPDKHFLKDYWENSRGGDNLASVYWLYDRTGDPMLLQLATKIDRNTANWRQKDALPNLHNVNVAESFREPATYSQQSQDPEDVEASYRDFEFIRRKFGQVPGGMFGADENAREGHDDPHQAIETCGMVEQIGSNDLMMAITGDPKWAANSEDVAFNTLPAAFTEDYRALRYLTAPNMVISDAKNHAPGIENGGPFLLMNPFGSRCCQHNSASAWVNFLQGTWMATEDNGLAALMYSEGDVTAKVGDGHTVTVSTVGKYPFQDDVSLKIKVSRPTRFPLYLRIPSWANGAKVQIGKRSISASPGKYVCLNRLWSNGDQVVIRLPMKPRLRVWPGMKNAVSVEMGALTFSLKIGERFNKVDGIKNTQGDSGWQPGVDQSKWPTYEILPTDAWNYALVPATKISVIRRPWPKDNDPFTFDGAPIELTVDARRVPDWKIDSTGLAGVLPNSPVAVSTPEESVTLIPMGAARLRISSFPVAR